jgi:WD40 repeat protein
VIALDGDLRQTSERARRNVKKTAADADVSEQPEVRPVAQPQAVALSWSKDKSTLSLAVPGIAGAPNKVQVLKRADIPFVPDGAWLSRGDKDEGSIIVLKSGDLSDDSAQLAVVGNEGTVSKIGIVETRIKQIDASGRIVFFCQAWSNGYFIKTGNPGHQIQTHQYVKGGCGSNSISYSQTEDLVAFTPSSNSGDIEQPELVDAQTGIERAKLGGHTSTVAAVDISPDGSTVLTVTEEGVIRLWRARVGADDRLAQAHGGKVLSGKYDADVGDGRMSSDFSGPAYDVLLGDNGLLKKEAKSFELASRPDDSLLVASSDNEIIAFSRGKPTVPLFRKPLGAKLTDIVHARGSPSLFTADESGTIRRWSIADGSSVEVFATQHEPILLLQWTSGQGGTLDVVTPARLLHVDPDTGRAEQKAVLPEGAKPDAASLAGGYLSYCKQQDDGNGACELMSIATGAIILRAICVVPLRVDERLAVAWCDGRTEALPVLADISGSVREIEIFPDANTVAATGLSARAALSLAPVDGCRRAFISLGGGIADNLYRGEGLLYDFAQHREIARTKGDPSTDYQGYGGGAGLPVFCDAQAAAEYARDVLKVIAAP